MACKYVVWLSAATILTCLPAGVSAKDRDQAPPEVYTKVADCRTVVDDTARLACYDESVGALVAAQEAKDVVVFSQEDVRKTRRGLFGFLIPDLGLFGGKKDDEEEDIKEITATIASYRGGTGRYVFVLEDGAVWEQTDGAYLNRPDVGDQITIKRAALGSYMARVGKGTSFRIKRRN